MRYVRAILIRDELGKLAQHGPERLAVLDCEIATDLEQRARRLAEAEHKVSLCEVTLGISHDASWSRTSQQFKQALTTLVELETSKRETEVDNHILEVSIENCQSPFASHTSHGTK